MFLVTTSPLFELVWITGRGLSLRYAGSSMGVAENNTTVDCNAESSNIIMSSPQCSNDEQNKKSNSLGAEILRNLNPEANHAPKSSQKFIIIGSPKSMINLSITSELPELKSKSYHDLNPHCKMAGGILRNNSTDSDDVNEKEVCSSLRRNVTGFDLNIPATDAFDVSEDKAFFSGQHSVGPVADSVACREKNPLTEIAEASHDNNHNGCLTGSEHHPEPLIPASNSTDSNIVENVKPASSSSSTEHGFDGLVAKENRIKGCSNFSIFGLLGQRYLGNIKTSDVEKEIETTSDLGSSPQIACENETLQTNHIDNSLVIRSQSADNVNIKNQQNSKHHIQCDKEGCDRTFNKREDSNESMESSNSSKRISKGKRALEIDSNSFIGSKRFKMDDSEGFCARALIKRNSSFMNWTSSITNSVARLGQYIPAEFCEDSPKSMMENHLCRTNEKTASIERLPVGFTSVFQSYSSSSMGKDLPHHCIQEELSDRKELRSFHPQSLKRCSPLIKQRSDERKEFGNIRDHSNHENDNSFSPKDYNLKFEEPKQGSYQVENCSLAKFNMHTSFNTQTTVQRNSSQECTANKTVNPKSSTKNIITCSKKSQDRMLSYVPNSSHDVESSNRRNFYENLWISRFLRKDSVLAIRPLRCRFGIQSEHDKQANETSDVASKTQKNEVENDDSDAGNHFISNLQCQNFATSKDQEHAPGGPSSSNSHRPEVGTGETPLHQFEDSEARTTFFGKRLELPRHIMPKKGSGELLPCANTAYILKGKNAYNSNGSRIIESCSEYKRFQNYNDIHQLDKLQQFIKSNDDNVTASCYSHCFRKNCSENADRGTCSKMNSIVHHSSIVSKDGWIRIQDKSGGHGSCSRGTKVASPGNPLHEHDQKVIQIIRPQRGESRVQSNLDTQKSCSADKIIAQFARHLNPSEGSTSETMLSEKQFASGLRKADARDNQSTPLCSSVANEVIDEPTGIFEAIRSLRLSRTEMMRLLTSPHAFKKLEGFFLRLRLGQWERGLGGTGYHVARINGASNERTLMASIGHFTCIVDSRFVSNHDYVEDELKAWWNATSRSGKIPSEDELSRKINERAMLGV